MATFLSLCFVSLLITTSSALCFAWMRRMAAADDLAPVEREAVTEAQRFYRTSTVVAGGLAVVTAAATLLLAS